MLQVSHLTKIYNTKGGVSVTALDDVSVRFPETGMVFLLGKSGSGKSTLLNVCGGRRHLPARVECGEKEARGLHKSFVKTQTDLYARSVFYCPFCPPKKFFKLFLKKYIKTLYNFIVIKYNRLTSLE